MREPTGPNAMAEKITARLVELEAAKAAGQRGTNNVRIRELKSLLRWCKSRAGYVE
jgi:hypothetical protein